MFRFQPWVHLHGVMLDKWWLDQNTEWQQLVKQWPSPMGGNAGVLTHVLPQTAETHAVYTWQLPAEV